jgi:hypothetical protein
MLLLHAPYEAEIYKPNPKRIFMQCRQSDRGVLSLRAAEIFLSLKMLAPKNKLSQTF